MQSYRIYAGGEFIESSNKSVVVNPFDGSAVANFWLADSGIYEKAIEKAQYIRCELSEMPAYLRYKALMYIAERIEAEKDEFTRLICLEAAKPYRYSLSEVRRAIQTFVVAAEECKRLPGEIIQLDWTEAAKNFEGIVKYFPAGLVAGIAPFNFPLNLAVHKIAPALAAGCPIILKPASSTPLSTLHLARIIDDSPFPKGSLSVLPMNRETGNLLVADNRIKVLSFTGSPEVGWKMKSAAGKKKVVLELGGNAGAIVTSSANIEDAVRKCIIGGFSYSGQVCIHTQRIYVQESVYDDFVELYAKSAKKLKYGNPLDPETEISSMIDDANAIRVADWVAEAIESGAELICGGNRNAGFYEPTILTNTNNSMKVCSEEIFGPVVVIEKYSSFTEAVNNINNTDYGLQAGVFTNNLEEVNYSFENIEVGGIIINESPTFRVDHMPYGGVKESGLGREGVKYAMMDMLEARILVKPIR